MTRIPVEGAERRARFMFRAFRREEFMPIYEYLCQECEQIFEEWQKTYEEQDLDCPVCGGRSRKLISNTSFVLKGTGWYTTDYCKNPTASGGAADNGNGSSRTASEGTASDATSKVAESSTKGAKESSSGGASAGVGNA